VTAVAPAARAQAAPDRPLARSAVLALVGAAASWGVATAISKRAVAEIPPLTLLAVQLGASLVVLAVLMRWRGVPFRDPTASPILGRLGLLNPGIAYALSLLGLVSIGASLSVLLWAAEPLMILLLAAWFLRERLGLGVLVLSPVAAAGMALTAYTPNESAHLVGIVLTLAGVACCAVYTIVARRWLGTAQGTAAVVVTQQVYALALALAVVAVVWLTGGAVLATGATPGAWLSAIVSGVLYYGVAYWLYLSALRRVPASLAAASFYLVPVFGLAAAFILLGERLEAHQWLGAAIAIGAVYAILRPERSAIVSA
jgi:drug/metabolite transporter (DMT)-like permease